MDVDRRRAKCAGYSAAWRARNPEKAKAWALANPERLKALLAAAPSNSPEAKRERQRSWREENRDKCRAKSKRYRDAHPEVFRHHAMMRKARRLQATPPGTDLEAIKAIYISCPPGYHVDHEVPLVSPVVCGLHVPANLRYLDAVENLRKSNIWNP